MKKTLILGVLGLAVGVLSSRGQGSIQFNTYTANNSNGILSTFNGVPLDGTFTGELLYSLTPINDTAGAGPLSQGWTVGSTALFDQPGVIAGYIQGPNLVLPSYTSGLVYFEIIAFNGASYGAGTAYGHTASFSMPLATGTVQAWVADGNPANGGSGLISALVLQPVPEPATLALAGLGGLAALVAYRRKQA
ncbi:MAG TPA: PEP-CTERM sorting domain-containing protein [Verrucomicrobiae bacterium]|nr:PEP-CTERM sorting domain-containing protein [Verrucomicrobiae bacterium]